MAVHIFIAYGCVTQFIKSKWQWTIFYDLILNSNNTLLKYCWMNISFWVAHILLVLVLLFVTYNWHLSNVGMDMHRLRSSRWNIIHLGTAFQWQYYFHIPYICWCKGLQPFLQCHIDYSFLDIFPFYSIEFHHAAHELHHWLLLLVWCNVKK